MKKRGYIIDTGALISVNKENVSFTPLRNQLLRKYTPLVTIREVTAECLDVPWKLLKDLNIQIEPTLKPSGPQSLLDAFSGGLREIRGALLTRADRAVVGHAIATRLDILTTDRHMKQSSYREFLKRLDRLPDNKLPLWYIPEIIIVQRGYLH